MNRLSLSLIAVAVWVSAGWWLVISPYNNPVIGDTQIDLRGPHLYTMKLSPRFSYNYAIDAVFNRSVSRHDFACLVGGLNEDVVKETACGSINPVLSLGWSVFFDGKMIAHGKFNGQLGFVINQTDYTLPVGVAYLESGRAYVLKVAILASAGQLATLSPHISVVATSDYSETLALVTSLILLVVVGLLAGAVISYLHARRNPSTKIAA